MTTVAGFAAKCNHVAGSVGSMTRVGVEAGALAGKGVVQATMVANGVTPGKKLAGMRSGSVNVGYSVQSSGDTTSALLAMRGPAHIVNNPTKAHDIGAKKVASVGRAKTPGGRRRARNAKRGAMALSTPFGLFARVHSPGTPGKHYWEKAEPGVITAATAAMRKAETELLLKEFRP